MSLTDRHKRMHRLRGIAAIAGCILAILFLFTGCALFQEQQVAYGLVREHSRKSIIACTEDFVFREEFQGILDNLMTHYWEEDGNWRGDLQGDATYFASILLFALGSDAGDECMMQMARQTVSYEVSLIKRFFYRPGVHMDLVIGFPALARQHLYTGDDARRILFLSGVTSGNLMISLMPERFVSFVHDHATLYAVSAYLCFLAADAAGREAERGRFIRRGLYWIEKADTRYWDEDTGLYDYSNIMDWPQTTMMMALVQAYRFTGEDKYLDRCLTVLGSMDELCLDKIRGGYTGHPDPETKGLSGNNSMVWVLLDLYEVTGCDIYLEKARDTLAWILSEDLYDDLKNIICHHWDSAKGRAGYFCTGCNFHTLYNIYRYNRLKK